MTFILFSAHLGIKDALIKKFKSFSELKKYAKVAPDPELLGKIKVCSPFYKDKLAHAPKFLTIALCRPHEELTVLSRDFAVTQSDGEKLYI